MKIAVLIKRVPDTASAFTIAEDAKSVVEHGLQYVMNPYDEFAVEEAIQIKERLGGSVTVVSLGGEDARDTIRTALAMGADEGLLITRPNASKMGSRAVSRVLAEALRGIGPDLVLAGMQAVDDDAAQVPERVAEILDLPHASVVVKIAIADAKATVAREIEGGHLELELPLPAVISLQKGINAPRYPTMPNIIKAKKKPIQDTTPAALGLDDAALEPGMQIESVSLPRQKRLQSMLEGSAAEQVRELVSVLRDKEKIL